MKVKNLIELLQKEDPERLVVCQKDPEGNSYSPLSDMWSGYIKLRLHGMVMLALKN